MGDDPLRDLLLEHEGERAPPRRPASAQPAEEKGCPDIVRQGGDDLGALARNGCFIDCKCVAFHDVELVAKLLLKFGEGGDATAISLHGNDGRARIKKRVGQPARPWTDFVDAWVFQRSRDCCDPRQQLTVEDEVLSQGLARAKPMTGDHLAQRLRGLAQAFSARSIAQSAAIRIAAAIGRASARS